jgi:hypothetical protein
MVEIVHGQILIREEYNMLQTILIRDWYYTGVCLGSTLLAVFYYGIYCCMFFRGASRRKFQHSNRNPYRNNKDNNNNYTTTNTTTTSNGSGIGHDNEPFVDIDSFEYYNDIHFHDGNGYDDYNYNENVFPATTSIYNVYDDHPQFFDAMMFSSHNLGTCRDTIPNVQSRSSSTLPGSTTSYGAVPVRTTSGIRMNDDDTDDEDCWEDISDLPIALNGLQPAPAPAPPVDAERVPRTYLPQRCPPVSANNVWSSNVSAISINRTRIPVVPEIRPSVPRQDDSSSRLEEPRRAPNDWQQQHGEVERRSPADVLLIPTQPITRDVSDTEFESIFMEYVRNRPTDPEQHNSCDPSDDTAATTQWRSNSNTGTWSTHVDGTNDSVSQHGGGNIVNQKERHPFFLFFSW